MAQTKCAGLNLDIEYLTEPYWAPEGREGRSQEGPKGRQLEVL